MKITDYDVVKEKAKTVMQMTENNEVKALCGVVLALVSKLEDKEKTEAGFKPNENS